MNMNTDQNAIQIFETIMNNYYTNIQNDNNFFTLPISGLLYTCIERIASHMEACFILIEANKLQSAEALTRVAYEYIVTLEYIIEDDENRFYNYFHNYIDFEKGRISKWKKLISNENNEVKKINDPFISKKEQALKIQEDLINSFFSQIENFKSKKEDFPNFFDRFKSTGNELSYRTIYAGMSSQVHSNAEDIINKIGIIVNTDNSEEAKNKLKIETDNYSRLMIYTTISELYKLIVTIERKYLNVKHIKSDIDLIEKKILSIQIKVMGLE